MEPGPCCVEGNVTPDGKVKKVFVLIIHSRRQELFPSTVGKGDLGGVTGNAGFWHI